MARGAAVVGGGYGRQRKDKTNEAEASSRFQLMNVLPVAR